MRYLFLLLYTTSLFAIIDIAPVDISGENKGFSGSIYGSFEGKQGNNDKSDYEYGGRVQFDTKHTVTWLEAEVEKDTSNDVVTEDNLYMHMRHIHQIYDSDFAFEGFLQRKEDAFKDLKERYLIGGGIRWKAFDSADYGKFFIGMSLMGEEVLYTDPFINPSEKNLRLNSYISYVNNINNTMEIRYIGYYQPKLSEMSDFMSANSLELIIHLTEVFDLSMMIESDYDALPAVGLEKHDTHQKISFIYRFGEGDPFSEYTAKMINSDMLLKEDEEVLAVELKPDAEDIHTPSDTLVGTWESNDIVLMIALDGQGTYRDDLFEGKLRWNVISTQTQEDMACAQAQKSKVVIVRFLDSEGEVESVKNYLWYENELVSVSGNGITTLKR